MTAEMKRIETTEPATSVCETENLRAQVSEMQDLLARYQEYVLNTEAALTAFEGRAAGAPPAFTGKPHEQNSTLRLLELLVSNKILAVARGGLGAIEAPWTKEFFRNPFATSRWVALRRAQKRLHKRPDLKKSLAELDRSGR